MKKRLDAIIIKNTVLGGYSHKSLMYKNVLYNCDDAPLPRKMNRLVSQVQFEMLDYLAEVKQLNEKELPFVIGYINQVLNSSNDMCDYLRLLPEAVHQPIRHLIDTCPCKAKSLNEDTVDMLREKNKASIHMMRQRMVTNLLI